MPLQLASLEPTVVRQKKVYVGARSTPSTEYRRQKSSRLGVQESVADPLLAKVGNIELEGRVMLLLQQVDVFRSRVVSLRTGAASSKLDGRRRTKEHSNWCAKYAVNRDSKGRAFLDSARRQTD